MEQNFRSQIEPTLKVGWKGTREKEEEVLQNGSEVTIEEVSLPKSPEADTTLAEEIKSTGDEKEVEKEGEKSVKKEKEKKDKVKKKWSFRSISFSKKDKSKPARDEGKNGDLTKEGATAEPLTEEDYYFYFLATHALEKFTPQPQPLSPTHAKEFLE
uniref:Uncharacterized protein n=1 Tax=Timema tahoe TaxID=61484 RepID=A0A7R9IPN4_9NEOP|nr:unnamed protein product [Timema tahoe]